MSAEIANHKYLHRPSWWSGSGDQFRYNILHDLESAWWLSIWILFSYTDKTKTEYERKRSSYRKDIAHKLFRTPKPPNVDFRVKFLTEKSYFDEATILDWPFPEKILKMLNIMRDILMKYFPELDKRNFYKAGLKFATGFPYLVEKAGDIYLVKMDDSTI